MCGRFALTSSPEALRALFRFGEEPHYPARYNVAPTQPVAVIRRQEGERHFALLRWGLIPPWVKDPRAFSLLVNARGESVLDKAAFRNAMKRRRCLVPADGFYEWTSGNGRKRPFFVRNPDGGLLALAGLWESWMGPNGEELDTVCIVTTRANETLAAIHDRMPVIVPPEAFDRWLDCDRVDAVAAADLIAPAPDSLLEAFEVSTAVNRAANDSPTLVAPLAAQPAAPERRSERPVRTGRPGGRARTTKSETGQGSLF